MKFKRSAVAAASMLASIAFAKAQELWTPNMPQFVVGMDMQGPPGYYDMCDRKPMLCAADRMVDALRTHNLTGASMATLNKVNKFWNQNVIFQEDIKTNGVVEYWDQAVVGGPADCEDIVRAKLEDLITNHQFPRDVFMQAVTKDSKGNGHLVLAIRTDQGIKILDNLHNQILNWEDTTHEYQGVLADHGRWRKVTTYKPLVPTATSHGWQTTVQSDADLKKAQDQAENQKSAARFATRKLLPELRGTFPN